MPEHLSSPPEFPPETPDAEAEARLDRVFTAAGCRTQMELADFFGLRQSSISDAKKRGAVPPDWLLMLLEKKGINPGWVKTGQGPRLLGPADPDAVLPPVPEKILEVRPPEECSAQELFTELVRRALDALR